MLEEMPEEIFPAAEQYEHDIGVGLRLLAALDTVGTLYYGFNPIVFEWFAIYMLYVHPLIITGSGPMWVWISPKIKG